MKGVTKVKCQNKRSQSDTHCPFFLVKIARVGLIWGCNSQNAHKQIILDQSDVWSGVYRWTAEYFLHNVARKINPGSHSSRRKICLHKIPWFIDYAEINNTAIVLACTQTVIYIQGWCMQVRSGPNSRQRPCRVILIQSLFMLFYYPCGSLLYACNAWVLGQQWFHQWKWNQDRPGVPNFNHPLVHYSI